MPTRHMRSFPISQPSALLYKLSNAIVMHTYTRGCKKNSSAFIKVSLKYKYLQGESLDT